MEKTPYERGNQNRESRRNGFCFGRITAVYPEKRLCQVKTFMGSGSMDDNHIPNCQWINMDANPEGDESTNIPRTNSYGMVFFIDGEPYIFGFFSPLTGTGSAQVGGDKEELNEGDRVLKTVGKNKIIMRAHGEIEIQSTNVCRTTFFPDRNLINTLCRNYEFRTDGGTIDWLNDGNDNTLCRTEYRDNIKRSNVIIEEKGLAGEFISRTVIGVGAAAGGVSSPVWEHTVKNTGETVFFVHAPNAGVGHKQTILPSGETTTEIGGKLITKATPDGNLNITNGPVTINISPGGVVDVKASGNVNVTAKKVVIEAPSNVEMNGAKGEVLTHITDPIIDTIFGEPTMGVKNVKAG